MKHFVKRSITLSFLLFVLIVAIRTNPHILWKFINTFKSENTVAEHISNFKDYYTDGIYARTHFINLNGCFANVLGIDQLNNVTVYEDDYLGELKPPLEMKPMAESMAHFSMLLQKNNIPFLYIQAPDKLDLKGDILPLGCVHASNQNADDFLKIAREMGVDTFDLRPLLVATKEDVKKHFFRTDHHWNNAGAFLAYQHIAKAILTRLNESTNLLPLKNEAWKSYEKKNIFQGSFARRTGIYYKGLDDYEYSVPLFETRMSFHIPSKGETYSGDFIDANVRKKFLVGPPENTYCTFIGGDFPLARHNNEMPYVKKRIVILKDSFTLPIQAYLSTIFESIDVIDLRHIKNNELKQMLNEKSVDLVIQMLCPRAFIPEMFDYQISDRDFN